MRAYFKRSKNTHRNLRLGFVQLLSLALADDLALASGSRDNLHILIEELYQASSDDQR